MWWPRYQAIIDQFGYNITTDQEAADLLSEYIKQVAYPLVEARKKVQGKHVVVCGAGPSICQNLEHVVTNIAFEDTVIFAADGATTACLEYEVVPDFILTDLDGNMEDIVAAQQQGAVVVMHAHGDNIPALQLWVPRLKQSHTMVPLRLDHNRKFIISEDSLMAIGVPSGQKAWEPKELPWLAWI